MKIDYLNQRRKELGFDSVDQLANEAKISIFTLRKIFTGEVSNPRIETVYALAKALKCNVDDFLDDNDSGRLIRITPDEETVLNIYHETGWLSPTENEIIKKYRDSDPQLKKATCRLLDISVTDPDDIEHGIMEN